MTQAQGVIPLVLWIPSLWCLVLMVILPIMVLSNTNLAEARSALLLMTPGRPLRLFKGRPPRRGRHGLRRRKPVVTVQWRERRGRHLLAQIHSERRRGPQRVQIRSLFKAVGMEGNTQ
eukprot:Hpha_TRINITY_DN8819_c0_g1::TRINITY_DN8819_c0_g1_i1::g.141485::m.141485